MPGSQRPAPIHRYLAPKRLHAVSASCLSIKPRIWPRQHPGTRIVESLGFTWAWRGTRRGALDLVNSPQSNVPGSCRASGIYFIGDNDAALNYGTTWSIAQLRRLSLT
jgi:hypothetical protein